MTRQLYELCGIDAARVFSPYCWRSRMALAHKRLSFESVPWRFTEGERLAFGPMAATMMLCPEPAMTQEQALFRLLGTARAHRFDETGALVIEGEGGPLVARR